VRLAVPEPSTARADVGAALEGRGRRR